MTDYATTEPDAIAIERALRMYLDQLVAQAGGKRITVYRVARMLFREFNDTPPPPTDPVEAILHAVAYAHGLDVATLRLPDRTRAIAWARHHAVWELRNRRPDLGLNKLAAWLNRVHHTTVMNSLRKFGAAVAAGHYEKERTLVERALTC